MKVLWFAPVPMPEVCQSLDLKPSYGGWWVHSLLRELVGHKELEIAVAWWHQDSSVRRSFSSDRIKYYVIPEPGRFVRSASRWHRLDYEAGYFLGLDRDRRAMAEALAVVEDYEPDLVHVFGSENRYGLASALIQAPLVIWIQGILDVYRHHFFGSMGCLECLRNPRLLWNYHRMTVDAACEREVFRRCRYFIGRTSWDAAHQARLQPRGHYYSVQDCIRSEFSAATPWNREEVKGTTIYTTTSTSLFKGTDVLVHAIGLLRSRFPDIRLRVAGFMGATNPVARRLRRLVCELGLSNHVEFVGQLDGAQIVQELRQARVFVLPSFIENNPNSLAEAQLVGTPVVAAFAGGVPDMMTDGEMGLGFQPGDSATLAWQIARLLTDEPLAARLAGRARSVAHDRHSPGRIVEALLRAYHAIVESSSRS